MKRVVILLVLLLPVAWGLRWAGQAFEVVVGYSAKQLCSGVFVSGFEPEFVINNDIHLSMGVLGPLLSQLELNVDRERRQTDAALFGQTAHAVARKGPGCVLNPLTPVAAPQLFGGARWSGLMGGLTDATEASLDPVLDAAFQEPEDGQRRTLAILVMRGNKLVAQRYADGVYELTPLQGWSMNKSLMSTWIGMQVQAGKLDLEMPIAPLLDQAAPDLARRVDPALNLGHLLHMESGLDFEETYFPGDDATRMLYRSPAMWTAAPGNGQRYAPGRHFSYSSGDTNLASWVWQQSLGQAYPDWLKENFTQRLYLAGMVSERDASGTQVGSSYTYMAARDWAIVGWFWLKAWQNGSELLPENWMREATTPRPSAVDGNYGRGFWLNAQGKDFPNLPRNMFYASGHNGQYVVMFPDEDVVVVRLGLSSGYIASGITPLLEGVLEKLPPLALIEDVQPSGR